MTSYRETFTVHPSPSVFMSLYTWNADWWSGLMV